MAQLSDRMRALVQPHLAQIEPYDPAFSQTRINLSANENTYPPPPAVRAAVDDALAATPLNRYPDPMSNRLRDLIAARGGHSRRQICVGNGGDELLFNFIMAFGGQGRTLLNCPPAFSEYEFFASVNQTQVKRVWRDPETFELDMPRTLEAASRSDMVILTSPNNPTGNLVGAHEVEQVCEACPGMVMVDEAYIEFADPGSSVECLLPSHPNLVVLHTLSKAFGEAGVRCGYVVAAPDVIDVFAAVRQIYSVNVLTQAAAEAALRMDVMFDPVVRQIRAERERVVAALRTLLADVDAPSGDPAPAVWPSQGNFVLARVPDAARVRERLRDEYSILVRDFSSAPGLAGCLRITVGTPEENDEVLRALSQLIKEDRS